MKPLARFDRFGWSYTDEDDAWVLQDVHLELKPGERVGLVGRSGCGKSTLALALNGIIPQSFAGRMKGRVEVLDCDTSTTPVADLANQVSMVLQSPDDQMTMILTQHEVASGPANLGLPQSEIQARAEQALTRLHIEHLAARETSTLSGGEKQKVAIAAAMAMEPKLLIADEPTTDLDPRSKQEVVDILKNTDSDMALLVISHDMEVVSGLVDRVVIMDQGTVMVDGVKEDVFDQFQTFQVCGTALPQLVHFCHLLRSVSKDLPTTYGMEALAAILRRLPQPSTTVTDGYVARGKEVAILEKATYNYPGTQRTAVKNLDLSLRAGEMVAIVGNNGAGKTTLSKLLLGLLKPSSGRVMVLGEEVKQIRPDRVGYVHQNPDAMLCTPTVEEEVSFVLRKLGVADWQTKVASILQELGLTEEKRRFPLSLSKGQRQKLAYAAVSIAEPPVLILDEPTTGVDGASCESIMQNMDALRQAGKSVVFVTHDMNLAFRWADRIVVMQDGQIVADMTPRELISKYALLQEQRLTLPPISELARSVGWPAVVSPEELFTLVEEVRCRANSMSPALLYSM